MDGLWWKTLWTNGWFVGTPIFGNTHMLFDVACYFTSTCMACSFGYAYPARDHCDGLTGGMSIQGLELAFISTRCTASQADEDGWSRFVASLTCQFWEVYPCLQRGKTGGWKRKCCLGPKLAERTQDVFKNGGGEKGRSMEYCRFWRPSAEQTDSVPCSYLDAFKT